MTHQHQPSGLIYGLELRINPEWTPEQALAVIELIDDLRERIWAHYELILLTAFREDRVTSQDVQIDDPPF